MCIHVHIYTNNVNSTCTFVPYLGSIHMRMYTYIHAVCIYMYIVYYICKCIAFGA